MPKSTLASLPCWARLDDLTGAGGERVGDALGAPRRPQAGPQVHRDRRPEELLRCRVGQACRQKSCLQLLHGFQANGGLVVDRQVHHGDGRLQAGGISFGSLARG